MRGTINSEEMDAFFEVYTNFISCVSYHDFPHVWDVCFCIISFRVSNWDGDWYEDCLPHINFVQSIFGCQKSEDHQSIGDFWPDISGLLGQSLPFTRWHQIMASWQLPRLDSQAAHYINVFFCWGVLFFLWGERRFWEKDSEGDGRGPINHVWCMVSYGEVFCFFCWQWPPWFSSWVFRMHVSCSSANGEVGIVPTDSPMWSFTAVVGLQQFRSGMIQPPDAHKWWL